MKHGVFVALCVVRLIEHAACEARFRNKTGKGRISTAAFASILAHPGKPIFPETGIAGIAGWNSAISHQCALRSTTTSCSMHIRVESSTVARGCVHVKRRLRATVGSPTTAVQHLTNVLFLSKSTEPLHGMLGSDHAMPM